MNENEYMCVCIRKCDRNISYETGKEYYYEYDYYNDGYNVYSEHSGEDYFTINEFNEIFISKSDIVNKKICELLHQQFKFNF